MSDYNSLSRDELIKKIKEFDERLRPLGKCDVCGYEVNSSSGYCSTTNSKGTKYYCTRHSRYLDFSD